MQTSSVKIASKIMYVMGIYTLVMSLFWIFLTEVIFVSDFLAFTGQSYADFLASSPEPAELYIITKKLWGVTMLLISLLIIFITKKSYSKAEKWSWYALLITGIMLWGSLMGYPIRNRIHSTKHCHLRNWNRTLRNRHSTSSQRNPQVNEKTK